MTLATCFHVLTTQPVVNSTCHNIRNFSLGIQNGACDIRFEMEIVSKYIVDRIPRNIGKICGVKNTLIFLFDAFDNS